MFKCGRVKDISPVSFIRNSYPSSFPLMNITPVTEIEIKCTINSLKSKGSFML
jgi:hypothetical protein